MDRIGLAVIAALILSTQPTAFAQGRALLNPASKVQWTENIPAAVKQRRETGRPLVIYVTADYCGYCRKMERETWSDPQVTQRIRDGFVALKVDAEQQGDLVQRLDIEGLPTTIVFDRAGQRIQTLSGFVRPAAIMEALDSMAEVVPSNSAPPR